MERVLDEVYADPDFAGAEPGLLQRIFERVMELIARVFDTATGTGIGRVVGIVVLVGLGALLAWLVARGLRRVRRDRAQPVEVEGPTGRPSRDWLAEADERSGSGEHRAALRCHYRATLAWLAEHGLVDEVPGTTTGEYRGAVADAAPAVVDAFGALTEAFERAWYGQQPVTAHDVAEAAEAGRQARSALRRPVGAGRR